MTTEAQPPIAFVIEFKKISTRKSLLDEVKADQPDICGQLQAVRGSANMVVYDGLSSEQLSWLRTKTAKFGGSFRGLANASP